MIEIKLEFIKAKPYESETVLTILKQAAEEMVKQHIDHWKIWLSPPMEKKVDIANACQKGEFFFAFELGKMVGMYRLMDKDLAYWGDRNDDAWYIHSLVTLPDYKGQKVGVRILAQIEILAKENEIAILRLDCNANNSFLNNYYKSFGYNFISQKVMPHSLNNLYQKEI